MSDDAFRVDVTIDNDVLQRIAASINSNYESSMPTIKSAFDECAMLLQKSWQNWAMGGSIEGAADIRKPNASLASSIRIEEEGNLNAFIGTASPYARRIQEGTPEIDMKAEGSPWLNGKKSRVSRKDKLPYLIVPFRWGANNGGAGSAHFANTISKEAAAVIESQNFRRSYTTGETHIEKNAAGEDVARANYSWGGRYKEANKTDRMNGMVKMNDEKNTNYMTFRVISGKSKGWVRKAVPANDVVGAVSKAAKGAIENIMEKAIASDVGL